MITPSRAESVSWEPRWVLGVGSDDNILQGLVDEVGAGFGFAGVALGLVRDQTDELEYVAASGDDDDRRSVIGAHVPMRDVREMLAAGRAWGATLTFLPHDDAEDEGQWQTDDLLLATLSGDDGTLRGVLFLIDPEGDRRLPPEDRARLDAYLIDASRLLVTADRRQRSSEQARLAELLAEVLRRSTGWHADASDMVTESLPLLAEGLGAESAWWRLAGERAWHRPPTTAPWVPRDAEDQGAGFELYAAAEQLWAHQAVAVVGPRRSMGPDAVLAELAEALEPILSAAGGPELLLVPLGAGGSVEGALILTRAPGARDWSELEIDAARRIGRDLGAAIVSRRLVEQGARLEALTSDSVATLVHELKNPLTALRGHVELLEVAAIDPQAERSVRAISTAAHQLERTVQDLLLYARFDRGPDLQDRYPLDLVSCCRQMAELFSAEADASGVELVIDVPDEPVMMVAERIAIERVLSNLVGNAIKYSDPGSVVVLSLRGEVHHAVIEVSDQGIGIAAEDLQRLFSEFFRSPDPRARARSGTGLGLAVVRRIIDHYGGTRSVQSSPGEGSLFAVALPR